MNAPVLEFPTHTPQRPAGRGIIVDNFAGGGGASTGIAAGTGYEPDEAINHDPAALAMHAANHPATRHHCQSVWSVDPLEVVAGRPVDLAWFSPDCKHFSKAKGGKPVEKHIRDLAWVVVHWATRLPDHLKPKVIMLENVEEFQQWGPLVETERGLMPCPDRRGDEFRRWIKALKKAGYTRIQWRELKACDYGAPTIRKRLFLIARSDGQPIVWPKPTHGDPKSKAVKAGKLKPWRTAAECIDWSIPCPSIFERAKPLKEATCRRIAAGIMRYVVNSAKPFIVPLTHHGGDRTADIDAPFNTVTGAHRGEMAVVNPFVVPITHTSNGGAGRSGEDPLATITTAKGGELAIIAPHVMTMRNSGKPWQGCDEPTHTITAEGAHQCLVEASLQKMQTSPEMVAAFIAQHNGGFYQGEGRAADAPLSTITQAGSNQNLVTAHFVRTAHGDVDSKGKKRGRGSHEVTESFPTVTASQDSALVTSNLIKLRGTCADGQATDEPMPTVTAGGMHVGEVRAFLCKYYGNEIDGHGLDAPMGTVTTKDRFGLITVTIEGQEYVIADIGMRMLTPRELARAQGFPDSYILDPVCTYTTDAGNEKTGPLPKTHQIAKIGNSVCPAMAEALTRANFPHAETQPERNVA
ncbi:DNA cytosine methyltransferase [Asticcacaulis sp.]|uniref:DNA cytosine methyltransferase n=1 Tax=Asticcacaulis sp. TaxID=1872648 RepID=UPI003F7CBAF5